MEDLLANLLSAYGPFAVFLLLMATGFGIPLGEDLITIPAGILIAHGTLDPLPTALWAYGGVLVSDCMWFAICWAYGTPLLHKRWFKRTVHPRRLLEAKHQIEARGTWVIAMSRFIPGSRTPAITAAGILHLPFWKFLLATAVCSLVSVPLQLGLGYAIAKGIGTEHQADLLTTIIAVVVAILGLLIGLTWWHQFRSHRRRPKRAKAAWLRRFRRARTGAVRTTRNVHPH